MGGTWLGLATVLAASVPACIAAYFSYRSSRLGADNKRSLQTTNGMTIGEIASGVKASLVTGNDKTVGEMITEVHGKESEQDTDFQTHRDG